MAVEASTLTVLRPGMFTTIQDLGRWGHQHEGIPVAGPMDAYSHQLANLLVGNPASAAALEVTLLGPELQASGDVTCAVTGAAFALTIAGRAVNMHRPFVIRDGETLRFGARSEGGARAVVAVRGGIDTPLTLGSRATSVVSRMGPLGGRPLQAGDRLPIGRAVSAAPQNCTPLALPGGGARVRVILGPHEAMFLPDAVTTLLGARYSVTTDSNRMGYRLEGPRLRHAAAADILSAATPMGTLQVPSSGLPILLMADRQTTGGYAMIATVISADLPLAGQLAPGDWIEFVACTREAAIDAARLEDARLKGRPL